MSDEGAPAQRPGSTQHEGFDDMSSEDMEQEIMSLCPTGTQFQSLLSRSTRSNRSSEPIMTQSSLLDSLRKDRARLNDAWSQHENLLEKAALLQDKLDVFTNPGLINKLVEQINQLTITLEEVSNTELMASRIVTLEAELGPLRSRLDDLVAEKQRVEEAIQEMRYDHSRVTTELSSIPSIPEPVEVPPPPAPVPVSSLPPIPRPVIRQRQPTSFVPNLDLGLASRAISIGKPGPRSYIDMPVAPFRAPVQRSASHSLSSARTTCSESAPPLAAIQEGSSVASRSTTPREQSLSVIQTGSGSQPTNCNSIPPQPPSVSATGTQPDTEDGLVQISGRETRQGSESLPPAVPRSTTESQSEHPGQILVESARSQQQEQSSEIPASSRATEPSATASTEEISSMPTLIPNSVLCAKLDPNN